MPENIYKQQAELLLRILPHVMREDVFALKGGTAINFFWRDYPRLSVDIDLAYIKVQERALSLSEISDRLASIETRLKRIFPAIRSDQKIDKQYQTIEGLFISQAGTRIKIEVNKIIRGIVFPIESRTLCSKAEKEFELSVRANTLSFADLYGGKIVAALDRQHPRDLFDIKLLLGNEGLTDKIRKAFIVYLISHNDVRDPGLSANVFILLSSGNSLYPLTVGRLDPSPQTLIIFACHLRKHIELKRTEVNTLKYFFLSLSCKMLLYKIDKNVKVSR